MKIFKYFIPNLFEGSLLLACAPVPVCPWIGVVPGCLCARVPVDRSCARVPVVKAGA